MNVSKWIAAFLLVALHVPAAWAVDYSAGELRDPFQLTAAHSAPQGEAPADLKLDGLTWGEATEMAVINGKVVRKGDKIGNVQVIEISKDGVKLSRGGTVFMLRREGSHEK